MNDLIPDEEQLAEANKRYPTDHEVDDPHGETGVARSDPYGYDATANEAFLEGAIWERARLSSSVVEAAPSDSDRDFKRIPAETRAELIHMAESRIKDVWADSPEGVDAATLASNVVAAQEFVWMQLAAGVDLRISQPVQVEVTDEMLDSITNHTAWSRATRNTKRSRHANADGLRTSTISIRTPIQKPTGASTSAPLSRLLWVVVTRWRVTAHSPGRMTTGVRAEPWHDR